MGEGRVECDGNGLGHEVTPGLAEILVVVPTTVRTAAERRSVRPMLMATDGLAGMPALVRDSTDNRFRPPGRPLLS
jgi:hypothetical protein